MIIKLLLAMSGCLFLPRIAVGSEIGQDLIPVFARAAQGEPLRYVALGGSITHGAKGWIDDWLKEQFPKSIVTTVNSGIPGTGSELAVFRLERDVITHQPDLVVVEFCVNDWGLTDAEVYRYMETIIVRLKNLPRPPAILIVESAARKGVNLNRHRKVAQHYGLLEVDMQKAVDTELVKGKKDWLSLFKDDVHPNQEGNKFYTKVITETLAPFVKWAKEGGVTVSNDNKPTIPLLGSAPLLLDAHLVELMSNVTDWNSEAVPGWPGLFFRGVLSAGKPRAALTIPLRGTTLGLFYMQQVGFGGLAASVDGGKPQSIDTNVAHPYNYVLLGKNLKPGEHVINVEVSSVEPFKPVKIGYALVAGVTEGGK